MGKLKDLTGQKFTNLLVIKRNGSNKYKKAMWLCQCDCGKYITTTGSYLLNGDTKSCGCLQSEQDLSGNVFGKTKVIKKDKDIINPNGKRNSLWLCECDCGNQFSTYRQSLMRGYYNNGCSCCKINKYELTGEYGIGYTSKGEEFYFDLEDYDKIKKYSWHISNGYVKSKFNNNTLLIHKLITQTNGVIDHINRKRNDNRKQNLRITTVQGNNRNKSKQRNNTSGIIGVTWNKRYDKWEARIKVDSINIYLGRYEDKKDAVIARLKGELKYFSKDFSPQRDMFNEYNI